MKKYLIPFYGVLLLFSGCASLTQTQIESINSFGKTTSNFSEYPSQIVKELSEVRLKRGLLYAQTLTSPDKIIEELDSVYNQKRYDDLISSKVDVSLKVIDKYAQSLVLLSSDKFTANLEEQAEKFGIGIDSLISLYNSVDDNDKDLPKDIGSAISKIVVFGGKQYIKIKQAKELKKFVIAADTLITITTNNLIKFLKSDEMNDLINTERIMIKRDFNTYLKHKTIDAKQAVYFDMKNSMMSIDSLRSQTIKAVEKLGVSHREMVKLVIQRKKLKTTIGEIQALYEQVKELKETIEETSENKEETNEY